jgi:hypothetical protein
MADYMRPTSIDDYRFAIARGQIQGASSTGSSGYRNSLSIGNTYDIWGGTESACVELSSAERLEVTSTNANDTDGGSGAEYVTITGLDNSYNEITEVVSLSGLTASPTTQTFLRVNSLFSGGSNEGGNVGEISLTSEVTNVEIDRIGALQGFSNACKITVPAGCTGVLTSMHGGGQRNDDADIMLKARIPSLTGKSYSTVLQQPMSPLATGLGTLVLTVPARSDVKLSIYARTNIDTITGSFSITFIPD